MVINIGVQRDNMSIKRGGQYVIQICMCDLTHKNIGFTNESRGVGVTSVKKKMIEHLKKKI